MSAPSLKDVALKLAAFGWFVFPCGVKLKTPDGNLAPHGFQSASNDLQQVEAWWATSPDANIGIDLGRSNLTVLDFDHGEPPAELTEFLKNCYTVKTARGTHVYFEGASKQSKMHFNGQPVGDVKSIGGYVLAPFSVHPDGPTYTLVGSGGIDPLPEGLLDKLTPQREAVDASIDGAKIPRGEHDTTLYRIACKLRHIGLEEDAIYSTLVEICEKRCENYGNDYKDMCKRKAQQACKHEVGVDSSLDLNQKPDALAQSAKTAADAQAQMPDVTKWREQFRSVGEMEDRPIDEIIKGVLQEGVCFIGANPGDGKTLTSLAFAKAICTGTPLFGLEQFSVARPRTVIYLIPETRDPAFRKRCEAFRIPDDKSKFMARTVSAGVPLMLDDPYLRQAVAETHAVVFLDTAARFMKTNDENSAAQNRSLVDDVVALQAAGAVCVVLNHHATKASQSEEMTLENMLRGTGDFAAMCDVAYGIRKDRGLFANGNGPMEIDLVSLKDRELIGALTRLRLAASRVSDPRNVFPTTSIIHETGNFKVVSDVETWKREVESLESIVSRNPTISIRVLALESGTTEYRAEAQLQKAGWHRVRGGKGGGSPWHKDEGRPCPYAKDEAKKSTPSTSTPKTSKAPKPGIDETVAFLQRELAGTSPDGEYVTEAEVLVAAEKLGITDRLLNKARRVLGVVESLEDGATVLSLPGTPQVPQASQTVAA